MEYGARSWATDAERYENEIPINSDNEINNDPEHLEEEFEGLKVGCWEAFLFFVRHSIRDIQRRKCHFCLAFCSVFIAVLATLVVNTIIGKGPIVFLTLN